MRNTRQRRQQIMEQLLMHGSVQVGDLVERYGVSAVTIRADLTHLEAQALPAVIRDGRVLCPAIQPQDGVVAVPIRGKIDFVEYRLGIEHRP